MAKQKQIDTTAGRMGAMMHSARQKCKMSTDDAAHLLRIMPDELAAYETWYTGNTAECNGIYVCHGI